LNPQKANKYVTKEVLKKELSVVEKRLDAKIDSKVDAAVQSMKEYTDSRFTQLNTKIDGVERRLDSKIDGVEKRLDATMTKYFELMMQTLMNGQKETKRILNNHERRITALEAKP
jgi:hypothetical protein